ncbi:hypothetical protein CWC22_005805 [Pseudoalteromonas rubra]|uniref:Uncharacterized protein n=1 Tax=Pseudoalteromonas rubra TaxID=43658 RepID=A0A5S3USR2_9GAMM|nr:hypothetical protein CWC22_005805 [Pseudoalteromonas rubra]
MPGLFEGANRTLTALKISHLEPYTLDIGSQIFALLSTLFSRFKIDHLIKQIGIIFLARN